MKVAAVICEYNPFHNGHLSQIRALRRLGIDAVVAVLGGSFTQRGEAALADPYVRAKAAVASGAADLVIELPFPYSAAPARYFARAGVFLADALGFCDCLSFGCEDAALGPLNEIARALRSEAFSAALAALREDRKYAVVGSPVLRETALAGLVPDEALTMLRKPNNILALEYLRAIEELSSPLSPLPLPRIGGGHGDTKLPEGTVASAGALREALFSEGIERWTPFLPPESLAAFCKAAGDGIAPASLHIAERAVLYALRSSGEPFSRFAEAGGGLGEAIRKEAKSASSLSGLYAALPTKRYPAARIRRAVLSCLFGVREEDQNAPPAFTVLLAANETGLSLLHHREKGGIPIVTKPADGAADLSGTRGYELYRKAQDFFTLCAPRIGAASDPLKKSPFILSPH
ncbi:MAG: nucleotidyltransferase family protein [Clostridia bacterium]|nr:nucleotidyltransferase family protein [Clostridia bacterium]